MERKGAEIEVTSALESPKSIKLQDLFGDSCALRLYIDYVNEHQACDVHEGLHGEITFFH